ARLFLAAFRQAAAISEEFEPALGRCRDPVSGPDWRVAILFDAAQHGRDTVLESGLGFPFEGMFDLGNVGESGVRLAGPLRNVLGRSADQADQVIDAVGVAGADIEDLTGDR